MKSQINQLKSEAEANYAASRWEDSAKTYEHLVGLAQDNNDLALAIDFALAAIRSWKNLIDKASRINKLYQAIGIIGLKKAAIGFEDIAKEAVIRKNPKQAATNFEDAADGYSYILSFDKAKKCYEQSVEIFEDLSNQAKKNNDIEGSIHLFDRTSNLYSKISLLLKKVLLQNKNLDSNSRELIIKEKDETAELAKEAKKNIAKAHEELASFYLKKNDSDFDSVAEKEYSNAIKILQSIGETQEARKLESKKNKIGK